MRTRHWIVRLLIPSVIIMSVPLTVGCSGKRVGASVQDQTVVVGHPRNVEPPKPEPSLTTPPSAPMVPPAGQDSPAPEPVPDEPPVEAKILEELRRSEPEVATAEPPLIGRKEAETVVPPSSPVMSSVELADVFFDFDDFSIRSDAKLILEANAQLMADHADGVVIIEGHCDQRGSAEYNLVLGERRALAAKRYLQRHGVQASRMQVITYGKERPLCTQHTEDCYQRNRRAHFVFKQE
jgi:peptidoglycan-associated lipoprotein